MTNNSIILLLVLSISCLCSTRDVYIQPSEGEHCPGTCYNITTFGKIADSFSNSSGLVVHFLEGTHLLDLQKLVVFTNLTNAVFEGDGRMEQGFHETVWQSTVVIKCTEHSSTGIAFVNSSNITFRYITITNCGADMTSFGHTNVFCNGSLGYFKIGHIIAIDHLSIQNGTGNGLLIDTDGVDLIITDSSFAQNYIYGDTDTHGGNIAISYADPSSCIPQSYVHNILIINTNASFGDSELKDSDGIFIFLIQRSYNVKILLNSVIAYSNKGHGNINIYAAEHEVSTYNLTINNSLSSGANGYALMITSIQDNYKQCRPATENILLDFTIVIVNSTFTYNKNSIDRSVLFINVIGVKFTTRIMIHSTEMCHNTGLSGLNLNFFSYEYQSQFFVTLENFITNNNSSPYYEVGAAIHAVYVTALVLHNVSITNNKNMTGLQVYHTAVIVNGTSVFHNNTGGIDGGGLAMYGDSYLMFHEDSILKFTNNSAKQRGGAIFVDTQLAFAPCFFQYSDKILPKSVKITITDNKANTAGSVLFGGDIRKCILFRSNQTYGSECFNKTFDYSAQTGPSVISSEPTDVCFCDDNNTINCSQTQLTMTAYRGEEINISVVTVGQLNGVAPAILQIQPQDNADTSADMELHNTSAMNCTTIALKPIYQTYKLNVFGTESFKLLNINFSNCPLGFKITNKTRPCDCEELKNTTTTITCDATTKIITRQGDIWIGNISDFVVMHTPCPFDYCNTAQVSFSLTDPDPQCALNRTGILCGRCRDGLSLALGSNNCIQCPQFSYLALIIPFAAAGFGLVALLMVLNLTVSIGTINGLIFYASIVKISESTGIFFPNGSILVLSQFIAWLNLDLGIKTCFYHGMTAYAKVWLQFVFPLYIWFIIATIIVLCRYSTWLSNKIGGNVVQVLATLILLSFTKIFRTFASALSWIYLFSNETITVWYVDGNVPYFSLKHYILMAAAVLFLLLAVPYTLALLFDAVIEKYLTRIVVFRKQWIKFKPFVDAYHGPYKDNCRFWTGLLLLVRMSFTLVSLHLNTFGTLVFITTSTTVLLSLLVTFEGVYQEKYLNMLECLSFLNLGLLSALAAIYQNDDNNEQLVTIISVSVALVTFIGVLIFHMFLCFRNNFIKCCNKNKESKSLLKGEEESGAVKQLVEPTSSEVYMRRESLIY